MLLAEEECQTDTLCLRVGVVPCAAAHPVGGEAPLRRSAMLIAVESRRHPHSRRHPPALPGALHLYVLQRPHLALVSPAGLADIVGRRFGKGNPLPWNPEKSWAGSAAMFLGAPLSMLLPAHSCAAALQACCLTAGMPAHRAPRPGCPGGLRVVVLAAAGPSCLSPLRLAACRRAGHVPRPHHPLQLAGLL